MLAPTVSLLQIGKKNHITFAHFDCSLNYTYSKLNFFFSQKKTGVMNLAAYFVIFDEKNCAPKKCH